MTERCNNTDAEKCLPTLYVRRVEVRLPEYQVLLSFANDEDAHEFSDWWVARGWKTYKKFLGAK